MSAKNTAVFGIYPTQNSADAAVDMLRTKGFRPTDISVLFPENSGSKEFGHEKGTKSAEGAVAGGGTGAVIGGALGWLAGIGMLAIPGVGPFIAAGPIVAALAGMGAGGAIGGTTGALIGLGIPEYQAKRYEGRMRKGGILLSVHADDQEWVSKGRKILEQTGAEDIASTTETKGDFSNSDRPTALRLVEPVDTADVDTADVVIKY
jgi:Alternative complex III, ActD subunit